MKLLRGVRHGPLRVVLFGPEGVGKSSWAMEAPAAAFLGIEDGLRHLDVARIPWPGATPANPQGTPSWEGAMSVLRTLLAPNPPGDYASIGTLIFDTLDRLERLLAEDVARPEGGILENVGGGYGKGIKRVRELWAEFLALLDRVQAARPVHIVLLAHAKRASMKNPGGAEWGRWTLDLDEQVAAQTLAWADEVLFATFEVQAKKAKAPGVLTGRRLLRTAPGPGWTGKSRCGLPDPMPLDFGAFWAARAAALRGEASAALLAEARAIAARLPEDKRLEPKSGVALLDVAIAGGPGKLRRFITWAAEVVDPTPADETAPAPEPARAEGAPAPALEGKPEPSEDPSPGRAPPPASSPTPPSSSAQTAPPSSPPSGAPGGTSSGAAPSSAPPSTGTPAGAPDARPSSGPASNGSGEPAPPATPSPSPSKPSPSAPTGSASTSPSSTPNAPASAPAASGVPRRPARRGG